jgi:hypothetical protein
MSVTVMLQGGPAVAANDDADQRVAELAEDDPAIESRSRSSAVGPLGGTSMLTSLRLTPVLPRVRTIVVGALCVADHDALEGPHQSRSAPVLGAHRVDCAPPGSLAAAARRPRARWAEASEHGSRASIWRSNARQGAHFPLTSALGTVRFMAALTRFARVKAIPRPSRAGRRCHMRIEDDGRTLSDLLVFLTRAEAAELRDAAVSLLENFDDPRWHVHVSNADYQIEITIAPEVDAPKGSGG